jgi:hypothetical protein
MLHYPKIPDSSAAQLGPCVAFDKIDGTNLHWDWDRDFAWHAFGTRRDQFDLTPQGIEAFHAAHPGLAGCVELFLANLADPIDRVLRGHADYLGFPEAKAFTEYAGPNSFAGRHQPGDSMELVLFDVLLGGSVFVPPSAFVRDFGHLRIPRVVFQGKFSGRLTEDVRQGKFGVREGVIIKGGQGDWLWMCKVKTLAYQQNLKRSFGERWQEFWE